MVFNGNRTQWSLNLSMASMITYQIGWHEVLLPVNHNYYNVRKRNIYLSKGFQYQLSIINSKKNLPFRKFVSFKRQVVVAMVNVINYVIGGFSSVNVVELTALTLWLQLSDYSQLSYYTMQLQLHRTINEKKQSRWCTNHIWGNWNGYDLTQNATMLLCDIGTYFYLVYLHCRLVTSFLLFKSWRELLKTKSMWPLCSQEKKGCYLLYQVPLLQVALRFVWNIICSDLWQKNEVKTSYWCKNVGGMLTERCWQWDWHL